MWKKKYFQEKKKTSSLEDRVAQLKGDVEFYHGKTMQIIENENKQPGSAKDTELRVRRTFNVQSTAEHFLFLEFTRSNHSYST